VLARHAEVLVGRHSSREDTPREERSERARRVRSWSGSNFPSLGPLTARRRLPHPGRANSRACRNEPSRERSARHNPPSPLETGQPHTDDPNAHARRGRNRVRARDRHPAPVHPSAEPHRTPSPRVRSARDAQAEPAGRASPTSSCSASRARSRARNNPQPQPDSRAARLSS
jgi:hypothetical protein